MADKKLNIIRNKNQKSAIVFIHGFLGDPKVTWGKFPSLVQSDFLLENWDLYTFGYSTSFLPDIRGIWSADAALSTLAILFKTEIETSPLKNYKEIVLIAHSMGGLIVQQAIIESDSLKGRLGCLIMFGTPSRGLKKSIPFNWFKKQLKDLCDDSAFIKKLRAEWDNKINGKFNFNLCVCAGERDEFVPSSSSLEPFDEKIRFIVNGNHLEIVKPDDKNSLSYRLVCDKILGNMEGNYPYNFGRVLSELAQFELVLGKFEGKEKELDEDSLVAYALALDGLGYRDKSIQILKDNHRLRTDALGTLAGRFKRLWLNEGVEYYAIKAYELYTIAFEISHNNENKKQMHYHKINQAFLERVYQKNEYKAKESANEAKKISSNLNLGLWEAATIAEASIHLEPQKTLKYYRIAIQKKEIEPWQILSMYKQAEILCEAYELDNVSEDLYTLFTGIKI